MTGIKKFVPIGIFILLVFVLYWRMLLPGYILTEDLVFGPHIAVSLLPGSFINTAPLMYALAGLNHFMASWVVEKILLFVMFFLLGYIPFVFLPGIKSSPARYAAALLYACNPFVYSRMLAGQYGVLYGYALLPLFLYALLKFGNDPKLKNSLLLHLSLFLIALFSIHYLAMGICILIIYVVCRLFTQFGREHLSQMVRNGFIGAVLFLIASSYWLIPAFFKRQTAAQNFTSVDWTTFAAVGHGSISLLLNLFSLNGFWGESQVWHDYFYWPQVHTWFWLAATIILCVMIFGFVSAVADKSRRAIVFGIIILGAVAVVLATGAGQSIFKPLNIFFYEHIPLWSGFRDSQKFIGLLALSYAVLFGMGADAILELFPNRAEQSRNTAAVVLFAMPLAYGFYVLFGFHGQLLPVAYPQSWYDANQVLAAAPNEKALVLPWHGYFSLDFDRNLIVANPGQQFFGNQAVVSQNIQLGNLYDENTSASYRTLDGIVRGSTPLSQEQALEFLREQGIGYIIYLQDLKGADQFSYQFIFSLPLTQVSRNNEVIVYKVE